MGLKVLALSLFHFSECCLCSCCFGLWLMTRELRYPRYTLFTYTFRELNSIKPVLYVDDKFVYLLNGGSLFIPILLLCNLVDQRVHHRNSLRRGCIHGPSPSHIGVSLIQWVHPLGTFPFKFCVTFAFECI